MAPTFQILSPLSAYDDRHACALSASEDAGNQCYSMQCSSSNSRWLHAHSCSTTVSSLFLKWSVCACLSIPAIPVSFDPQVPAMPSASQPPFHTVAETHQTVRTAILSHIIL